MKILIVDNSAMSIREGRLCTNNLNGLFIDDLIACGNSLIYFQFSTNSENNISAFDLERHGVRCEAVPLLKNKVLRYNVAFFRIIKFIRKVDFIYFYYPSSFKFATYLCRLLHKQYGLYIRGMNGLNDKVSHDIYKHAFTIFTVSDFFTHKVNAVVGTTVANTIRPMIPYTDEDVVHGRLYEPKSEYSLLYLGRIAKDKGLAELLMASKELKQAGYQFQLHIVGSGEYMPQLQQLHEQYGLSDCVSIDGPVFDNLAKRQLYLAADLYVLPTYHEGFPRTLYEAMIFGTPILTTFVGGIPALMKEGHNCLRIEPKSVESIVGQLKYAMGYYSEMSLLARNGASLVGQIINHNRLTHAQHLNQILKSHEK